MIRGVLLVLALAAMWVALWGAADPGTVVAGLLVATAVAVVTPVQDSDRRIVFRPLQAIRFAATFAGLLVVSTASMVRLVLTSRAGAAQGVLIQYELAPASYPVRTLIAHSVSLTPGTLTVDVGADGRTLTIHVIEERDVSQARAAIAGLEQRAAAAFAPRGVAEPDTEHPLEVS